LDFPSPRRCPFLPCWFWVATDQSEMQVFRGLFLQPSPEKPPYYLERLCSPPLALFSPCSKSCLIFISEIPAFHLSSHCRLSFVVLPEGGFFFVIFSLTTLSRLPSWWRGPGVFYPFWAFCGFFLLFRLCECFPPFAVALSGTAIFSHVMTLLFLDSAGRGPFSATLAPSPPQTA